MNRSPALPPRQVFLVLTATRWAPVGLVIGLFALVARERGLSVAETVTYTAFQGIAVLLLELPTSGLADALGRRPLLVVAGVINVVCALAYLVAHSFWAFAAAATLMGVYRALDSGPLEAWYVDAVHATDPDAEVAGDLAAQGTVTGVTIAAGSLVSGGLVAWHPWRDHSPLLLPLLLFVALCVGHLVATLTLLHEPPRTRPVGGTTHLTAAVRDTPRVVAGAVRLVGHNRVLAGIIAVELGWCAALVVFEQLLPIRLAELVGGPEEAGRWVGPVAAAGWGVFAAGSSLAGRCQHRIGVARTAILARVLNGAGAAAMGLATGPVGLVAAYLATYGLHGGAGVAHNALLHREATATNRATVLSLNSLVFFAAASAWAPVLGLVGEHGGVPTAMVVGGLASILGLLGYLPALLRPTAGRRIDRP
ncbi:MFS transporter [Arsenicicoccus sp. oral taxon 190]|uniref:MFS transporter n=1 Tax=Arsenicicoccus sp. oral taxon 190 TaxID=1658671 RepID=UPI00067A1CF7|nr:MFS transporter [Arsenicicoccus sp. oral taxon 190]AKT51311.1 MFS transporter [Arsenicicoccus sp. oral taxon 190]